MIFGDTGKEDWEGELVHSQVCSLCERTRHSSRPSHDVAALVSCLDGGRPGRMVPTRGRLDCLLRMQVRVEICLKCTFTCFVFIHRPNLLATGFTHHFFWPNALFPSKLKTSKKSNPCPSPTEVVHCGTHEGNTGTRRADLCWG